MPERRAILWTGGFDSTWLVVDALLAGDRVDAVTWRGNGTIPEHGWQKVDNEDAARRRIVHALPPELRRGLREVVEDGSGRRDRLGVARRWLALEGERLRLHREMAEATLDWWLRPENWTAARDYAARCRLRFSEQSPMVGAAAIAHGRPVEAAYVAGDDLAHAAQAPTREVLAACGVSLPLVERGLRKVDLLADARRRGFADLLALTWSCEGPTSEPVRVEPCGECPSCLHRLLPATGTAQRG